MALASDLLDQADHLASFDSIGRPKQASLRRAVSAAYYALFHEIVDRVVVEVVGQTRGQTAIAARLRRTVRHATVKAAAKWYLSPGGLPSFVSHMRASSVAPVSDLVLVCGRFVDLQEERHRADYDLATPFSRAEVRRLVGDARAAVSALRGLTPSDDATIFFFGCLLGDQLAKNQ